MDELLRQLEELTETVLQQIDHVDYTSLAQFVDIREQYMIEMKELDLSPADAVKYRDRINDLLSSDERIMQRMHQLKEEARKGIDKTRQAKIQQRIYESSYADHSMFYDTRK